MPAAPGRRGGQQGASVDQGQLGGRRRADWSAPAVDRVRLGGRRRAGGGDNTDNERQIEYGQVEEGDEGETTSNLVGCGRG
jgi:hypothetical protein